MNAPMNSQDSIDLVPLTLSDLETITGGEVESVTPHVFEQMSDRGEWGQPGYGDIGQFL